MIARFGNMEVIGEHNKHNLGKRWVPERVRGEELDTTLPKVLWFEKEKNGEK